MHPTRYDDPSGARAAQIAGLYREHARQLERRVACRACADPQTIEDACSFAWARLLTRPAVDLDRPQQLVLGWLTVTATREVWRLEGRRARERPYDPGAIEGLLRARDQLAASTDTIVADRDRLALVAQLPRRPRRFVLRLAMGYSHREIAGGKREMPYLERRLSSLVLRWARSSVTCLRRRLLLDRRGLRAIAFASKQQSWTRLASSAPGILRVWLPGRLRRARTT